MADDIKAKDDVKKDLKGKDAKGKGDFWKKYKWFVIGGGIIMVIVIFYFIHTQNSSAAAASGATPAGNQNIDPATGYPYGSAADLAALGSSGSVVPTSDGGTDGGGTSYPYTTGATGPAGAAGANKKVDLWNMAISILNGRGIKDPTHSQIETVWQNLSHAAGGKNAPPAKTPTPVAKPKAPKTPTKKK